MLLVYAGSASVTATSCENTVQPTVPRMAGRSQHHDTGMAMARGSRARSRRVTTGASTKVSSSARAKGRITVLAKYNTVMVNTVTTTASNCETATR